jgi:hypothetical protein
MYRPVQAGKPQAEARPARFPPPGYNPRASTTGPDSPHARHAQALNQDSKPVHLPPAPDAPSMYFSQARATGQRREPRDPLHQAQAHPIAPGQQENDKRRKEPFSAPRRPDLGVLCEVHVLPAQLPRNRVDLAVRALELRVTTTGRCCLVPCR